MWNASGTFATRFTVGTLTQHRTFRLPDADGDLFLISAGRASASSFETDRISASSIVTTVLTASSIVATDIGAGNITAGNFVYSGQSQNAPYNLTGSLVSNQSAGARFINTLKSWAVFAGTAGGVSIGASFNISSITRVASGTYTMVFQVGQATTEYGMFCAQSVNGNSMLNSPFTTQSYQVILQTDAAARFDAPRICTGTFGL